MFAARARAMSTGKPVTVTATTTATSVTVANPNGSFTDTIDALPVRAQVRGSWVPLNARLVRVNGGLAPATSTEPVLLSGGGSGPAVTLRTAAGQRLSLWLPARLPAPIVRGATALYRSVRPGIDVQLTADTFGGVAMKLIVRSRAAAASSWLRQFTVRYAAGGVRLTALAAGELVAVGSRGPVFSLAPPTITGQVKPTTDAARRASFPGLPTAAGRSAIAGDHIVSVIGGRLLSPAAPLPVTVNFSANPVIKSPGPPSSRRGTAGPDSTFPSPDTIDKPGYDEAQQVNTSNSCSGFKNWNAPGPG